jgi:hypothetical protein
MAIHILQVEVSRVGKILNTQSLPREFAPMPEAIAQSQRLAEVHALNGENREHGYWWYENKNRIYRLVVKG